MGIVALLLSSVIVLSLALSLLKKRQYKKTESQSTNENRLFKKINEYQSVATVIFSENFRILYANRAAQTLLNLYPYKQEETPFVEMKFTIGKSEIQTLHEIIEVQSKITKEGIHLKKVLMILEDRSLPVTLSIDRIQWEQQNAFIVTFEDISSEVEEKELIKKIREVDILTGLPSQLKAMEDIDQLVIPMQGEHKKVGFFLFGINNFNKIKFTLGFEYSNNILKKIAEFLASIEGEGRRSYRLDNDNFLHIVEDVKSVQDTREIGEILKTNLSNYLLSHSNNAKLIFSIGAVVFPTHGRTASKLIDHAFFALEQSTKNGDGSLVAFHKKQNHIQEDERVLVEEMKTSLKNGDFEVYYQPILNLETKAINAAEALIRWHHPRLGLLASDMFIQSAEVSGMIVELGTFVMKEVISQHKKWHEFGFRDIEIAINISARELLVYQLSEKMEQLFAEHEVEAKYFNFDISERDAVDDIQKTDYEFSILKEIGVSLSLDHFGIGGSSIEQLQKLPIRTLKIDQSLIADISYDRYHQETVRAIIMLANALNMDVIAGCVETKGQKEMLEELGCHFVQGHLFYKPAPAFEFQKLLRK